MHQFIISTATNMPQARRALQRFGQAVLRDEIRDSPFLTTLADLEQRAKDYVGALTTAAGQQGANAENIVTAVLLEHMAGTLGGSGNSSAGSGSGRSAGSAIFDDTEIDNVSVETYSKCFRESRFRAFSSQIANLRADTSSGRRDMILQGFSSGTALCAKLLLTGSKTLAKKHKSLALLFDARVELAAYFGWVMVVNPQTKVVPPLLVEWRWSGHDGLDTAMLKQFTALKFPTIDWHNGPNGINALIAWKRNQKRLIAYTDPLDFYCSVQTVQNLSDFCHPLFRGMGASDTLTSPNQGFTMASWCEFYIAHIKLALSLSSLKEQIAWLEDASIQFVLWWGLVAQTLYLFINSSQADTATLTALTTHDCAPAEHLREKQKSKELLDQGRQLFDWVGRSGNDHGFGKAPDPNNLPLLSVHRGMLKDFHPAVDTPAGVKPNPKSPIVPTKPGVPSPKPPGDGKKPTPKAPGSLVFVWVWLSSTLLLYGRRVIDIALICQDFKIADPSKYCWPFQVSAMIGAAKLAVCPKHGDPAHKQLDAGAHAAIPGLNLRDPTQSAKYTRPATDAELAKLPSPPDGLTGPAGKGSGGSKAHGKGGKGKGAKGGIQKNQHRNKSKKKVSFRVPA